MAVDLTSLCFTIEKGSNASCNTTQQNTCDGAMPLSTYVEVASPRLSFRDNHPGHAMMMSTRILNPCPQAQGCVMRAWASRNAGSDLT
eukprot:5282654-Amphidinium_carterae.1